MKLDIKELFDAPGTQISVSEDIDFSDVDIWGQKIYSSPVHIDGLFSNRSGMVTFKYNAVSNLRFNCDRCGKSSVRKEENSFEHWLARELESEDNDEFILIPNGIIDLDELVKADVTLELPFQLLCKDDCKGLCPICGLDLNEKTCDCKKNQVDSRLEKLKMLLDTAED